jgi:hypothetical protein
MRQTLTEMCLDRMQHSELAMYCFSVTIITLKLKNRIFVSISRLNISEQISQVLMRYLQMTIGRDKKTRRYRYKTHRGIFKRYLR